MKGTATKKAAAIAIAPTRHELALWRCAAALDPMARSCAGASLSHVLSVARVPDLPIFVEVERSYRAEFRTADERTVMGDVLKCHLTALADAILRRNGLALVPTDFTKNSLEDIPF